LYTNSQGIRLRSEAADNLALMLKDLQKTTGKIAVIASGYRSINDQFKQYVSWVTELGQEEADKVSARPGYSEHSLGTVVDFMSQDSGFTFTNEFDNTIAGKWLLENSYKYGFVQSYPKGKEAITGYNYEAWHYRYIGVENALDLKESNLTLKEWIENK
jgi:D-alanyl-D-alanine carboxypeptidase